MSAGPRSRRRTAAGPPLRWAGLVLLFVAGAVALTWPLAARIGEGIPLGTERVATVPLFNLWTLAWNVESAGRGYEGYWRAPIFHPTTHAFALSEAQPLTGALAFGIQGLGGSVLEAYNGILIGALALNGLLATALLRLVGLTWLPAVAGGSLVLALPFTHQELGVLQLVPLAGILLLAAGVARFAAGPSLGAGLLAGGGLAVAYGLSSQVAVFGALAVAPAVLWLWWPHRGRREARIAAAAGAVVFLVLVAPLVAGQMRATAEEGLARSIETVRQQSARPSHYLTSPWPPALPTPGITTAERPSARAFWPGTVRVLLALTALALAGSSSRWRRLTVAGALVLGSSLLLSFGAHLGIGGLSLVDVLRQVPGLAQVRSFFRFALFAQLAIAALAAGALQLLYDRLRRRLSRPWATVLVACLALSALFEMRPTPGPIEPLPALDLRLPWVEWIEDETEADDVLAFLPFPRGRSSGDYLATSQWMYWQMRHWRPMVNGYSGFFPQSFKSLKKAMETFPSPASLRALRDAGVRYCVVPRRVIEHSPAPEPDGPVQLVLVFRDETHELAIFELRDLVSTTNPEPVPLPAPPDEPSRGR
ncbi:MAG: hypothetical protein MI919_41770 [Holophagales bacterium]|nr:hypothetical protein [Holophagales bacterium]